MNTRSSASGAIRPTRVSLRGALSRGSLALALLGSLTPKAAVTQQRIALEGQGGISIPTGRLGALTDAGPNFGMQLGYLLSPRVALNLDGNVDLLNGARLSGGTRAPDMRVWRYGVGLSADLLPAERVELVGALGAGVGRFSSDEFSTGGSTERQTFGHTYFTSNAGLKLGYALSRSVTTYVGARTVLTTASETDSRVLSDLDPGRLQPFGSTWSVPVTVGLNVKVGGQRPARVASRPATTPTLSSPPDDRDRLERESRRLCEQAEAALAAGDYARARELYQRARADYPGTTCADEAGAGLDRVAALMTIAERVHFDYDRALITDEAATVLQRKAEVLKRHPGLRVTIEGHCDERGTLEYNQALGMRRARAAMQYLITLGVSEAPFNTVTYGEERPLVTGVGEQSWRQNRRAEFVVQNVEAL